MWGVVDTGERVPSVLRFKDGHRLEMGDLVEMNLTIPGRGGDVYGVVVSSLVEFRDPNLEGVVRDALKLEEDALG